MIRLDTDAAEEARENHFKAGDVARAGVHQIVGDDAQQRAEFEDVPGILSENGEGGTGAGQRIAFARDGLDQGGFAATVGSQDGHVLAGLNAKSYVFEHGFFTAHDGDAVKVEQGRPVWRATSP
jgi:hypothetical protein